MNVFVLHSQLELLQDLNYRLGNPLEHERLSVFYLPKQNLARTYHFGGMDGYHFFLISGYLDILDTDFFWILG